MQQQDKNDNLSGKSLQEKFQFDEESSKVSQKSSVDCRCSVETESNSSLQLSSELVTKAGSASEPGCDYVNREQTVKFDPEVAKMSSEPIAKVNVTLVGNKKKRTPGQVIKSQMPPIQIIDTQVPGAPKYRMRQPFKILTDIWGVLTSYQFKKVLYTYIDDHLKEFLLSHIEKDEIEEYVAELAKATAKQVDEGKWPDMPRVILPGDNLNKEAVVDSVVDNLQYRRRQKDKGLIRPFERMFNHIWNKGYQDKTLHAHIFPDVLPNMSKWCQPPLFIKIFTFATGTSEAQKLFLASPVEGDVSQFVIFGFKKQSPSHLDSDQFKQIVSALSERNAENLFYFTDNPKKAIEAKKAGLTVFVVCREGNQQYTQQELNHFNVIKSFDQLDFLPFQ